MTTPAVDPAAADTVVPKEANAITDNSDAECGAFFVNLFASVHHAINQFQDATTTCDPTTDAACQTGPTKPSVKTHDYEVAGEFVNVLGMLASIWAIAPAFLFVYPIWTGRTQEERTWLWDNHTFYMYAWFWFIGSHVLLFLPYVLVWL